MRTIFNKDKSILQIVELIRKTLGSVYFEPIDFGKGIFVLLV